MSPGFFLRLYCLTGLLFVIPQVESQVPRREFRGVWVATVANIDWPSRPGLSTGVQQEEILEILDRHKANGMNAIILQVRPTADALYQSELEPWSRFLTGHQGQAPDPFYDPLEFWVEESHRRGMELHAWLNPYRISLSPDDSLAEGHKALMHPEWCFAYGDRTYYSPANPKVWDFLTAVVVDVVRRYDIDAIHFDDYFYPYSTGEPIPDSLEFSLLGGDYYPESLEDWRRNNVDTIIRMLGRAIKQEKPWVKFGISPFGVWRNSDMDPQGSETSAGTSNYDGLFADVIRWQREGWIDYLLPQLYWRESHPAVGFSNLAHWWNDRHYGRSLYVGLGPYRMDRKSVHREWRKEKYLLRQIEVLRTQENTEGFCMFSSKHFFRDELKGLNRKLQKRYCPRPALVPAMTWIDPSPPDAPVNLRRSGNRLLWDPLPQDDEMDRARFFVLYRFEKDQDPKIRAARHIVALTGQAFEEFPGGIPPGTYRVSALDRLNNESPMSEQLVIGR